MSLSFPTPFLKNILSRFQHEGISPRERVYLIVGAATLLGLLIYGGYSVASSYFDRMNTLDRLIRQKQEARSTLNQIGVEYAQIKGQIGILDERIENDQGKFSLLSFLESLAGTAQVRSRIAYMRPQAAVQMDQYREISVEMKIENVTLDQAIRFLTSIEQAPHVLKIKNLHMRTRYANPQYLDVTFLVSTYEKAG